MGAELNVVRVGSSGIIEDAEGKILMALRGVYPKNIWVFPGGGVDFGETASDAFVREVKEETGIDIDNPEFITVHELIKPDLKIHRVIFFHRAKAGGGELKPSGDVAKLKWMTVDEIKKIENIGDTVMSILKSAGFL